MSREDFEMKIDKTRSEVKGYIQLTSNDFAEQQFVFDNGSYQWNRAARDFCAGYDKISAAYNYATRPMALHQMAHNPYTHYTHPPLPRNPDSYLPPDESLRIPKPTPELSPATLEEMSFIGNKNLSRKQLIESPDSEGNFQQGTTTGRVPDLVENAADDSRAAPNVRRQTL